LTIAASGQGRWQEELDFPLDCQASGFKPVLVCMDSTPNAKLDALVRAFESAQGECYIGDAAWRHLEDAAGETMSVFLEKYVRKPIQDLLTNSPEKLPDLVARWSESSVDITVGDESLVIKRASIAALSDSEDEIPDDVDEEVPG
jgi:hypothetical protein